MKRAGEVNHSIHQHINKPLNPIKKLIEFPLLLNELIGFH